MTMTMTMMMMSKMKSPMTMTCPWRQVQPWRKMRAQSTTQRRLLILQHILNCKFVLSRPRLPVLDPSLPSFYFDSWSFIAPQVAPFPDHSVSTLPASFTYSGHEHELTLRASVYDGIYFCDHCFAQGRGWVYNCAQCKFDVHPQCYLNLSSSHFFSHVKKSLSLLSHGVRCPLENPPASSSIPVPPPAPGLVVAAAKVSTVPRSTTPILEAFNNPKFYPDLKIVLADKSALLVHKIIL